MGDATLSRPSSPLPCWPCSAAARAPRPSPSSAATTASPWRTPWASAVAKHPPPPASPTSTASWTLPPSRPLCPAGSPRARHRPPRAWTSNRSPWTARPCGAAAMARRPAIICYPPTPMNTTPCSPRFVSMPKPTNTRLLCNCWAFCRLRAALYSAMRCSASVTCAPRSSHRAAITCSRSRATNWAWRELSRPDSPMRPAPAVSPRLFPPEPLPPPPPQRLHTSLEKGHGRVEKRTVRTTSILTLHQKWPGLAQGLEITRERTVQGKTTVEVEYALHYVRDVTLGEDACRVRRGSAPQVLAAVRNTVVHLLAGLDAASHPAAIRRFNAHP